MTEQHEHLLRDAFEKVSEWLESQQCYVLVCGALRPLELKSPAWFTPPSKRVKGDVARITVFRPKGELVKGAADYELAILAHEAGHWRSWERGERPQEKRYRAANDLPTKKWPSLPPEAKRMIIDEEINAWRHGRDLLHEVAGALPQSFWNFYRDEERRGLNEYKKLFGLNVNNADDAIGAAAIQLATAMRRSVTTLHSSVDAPERARIAEALRMLVRADRGIPEPEAKGYPSVIVLNLEAWTQQARDEGHDAAWLYRHCTAVDVGFASVTLHKYQAAIDGIQQQTAKGKPGPKPTQTLALALAKAAGIYAAIGSVRNLKSASRHLNRAPSPAKRKASRKR